MGSYNHRNSLFPKHNFCFQIELQEAGKIPNEKTVRARLRYENILLAKSRLQESEILFSKRKYDVAVYLCGYAMELALKARICKTLKWSEFPDISVNVSPVKEDANTKILIHADIFNELINRINRLESVQKSEYNFII